MDRYRLKNIIILILSLMNVFLLASLAIREGARQSAKETAVERQRHTLPGESYRLLPGFLPGIRLFQARLSTGYKRHRYRHGRLFVRWTVCV